MNVQQIYVFIYSQNPKHVSPAASFFSRFARIFFFFAYLLFFLNSNHVWYVSAEHIYVEENAGQIYTYKIYRFSKKKL